MNWLYSKWWKWLSVFLLLYVVIGSFMIQLGPGITKVSPVSLYTDSVFTLQITSYHSHFASPKAGKVQLWFKNQNRYYSPIAYKVISDEKIAAQFAVGSLQQDSFKPSSLDVVINNELDGTFALRDAITIVRSHAIDSSFSKQAIASEPEVKTNRHTLR